ncbi:high affinity sulfate transporter 1 [Microterricola gilva]|uniref:High affinity sulfate transporter 1 n=1 Tax=Microterricola gilva TaxID=393267 RepID=A0A4Q8ARG4_9MICO|nr:SulP family inorganic anion transporter [Microterricola gilva]RZU66695.1 high affinity sulfate transporter 1 [Microterricola gilva]
MQKPFVGLTAKNALRESMAGVTLLAIAVPLNIGYAQIAGLPPTAGLYALVLPAVLYALVVSSRQLIVSPDAAAAALVASSIGGLAVAGSADYLTLALAQAILCGLMFFAAAFFKLGFLANFLSKPILIGFVGGLALDIMVSQIAKMLGVSINSGGEFIEKATDLVTGLGGINWWSALLAALSIAVLVTGQRLLRAVPWALIVLILGTIVMVTTGLEDAGVAVLGPVESGPPRLTWPVIEWSMWLALVPSALALTLVTTAEGLLVSRSYGEKNGYKTSPNRDLFAFGLGNIAAGASGSFAVGSSTSRTAAMDQAGSRTQLPTVVMAAGTLLLLIFGTALLEDIPSPVIGAIVAVAIVPLLGFRELAALWKLDRFEFIVGVVCFLVTLLVGTIPGILVAFVLALINLAKRAANPAIDILAADGDPSDSLLNEATIGEVTVPGVLVIRMGAPLFFANGSVFSDAVKRAVRQARDTTPPTHVVIDMEAVTDVDVTAAESFVELRTWLTGRGITLSFSRTRLPLLNRLTQLDLIGDSTVFETNRAAIAALGVKEKA